MTTYQVHINVNAGDTLLHHFASTFDVNKESFLSMVELSSYLDDLLFQFESEYDTGDISQPFSMTLQVFAGEDILFKDIQSFEDYKKTHRIESRLRSNWSLLLYVNDIAFYGEIEEGMIVK